MGRHTFAAALALLVTACPGFVDAPPPAIVTAPQTVSGASIFVPTEFTLAGTYGKMAREEGLPAALHTSLVEAFRKAGFRVLTRESDPHEFAVELTVSVKDLIVRGDPGCQPDPATLRITQAGSLVEEATIRRDDAIGARTLASLLVNELMKSPRMASVTRRPEPIPSAVAVAPVPTPPAATAATVSDASGFGIAAPQPTAYALVVGVEHYRDVAPAAGGRSDAERFAALMRRTLGVPERQVIVALDDRATKTDIEKQLRLLKGQVQPGGRLYFYFAGHGAPEPTTGDAYLLPYDGDPRSLDQTALPMSRVLQALGETPARDVFVVVDACFSGSGARSVLAAGTRPLVRVKEVAPTAKVALFSASSATEISGSAAGVAGGVFTKYVTEAIGTGKADANGDGQISLQELSDWVKPRVARDAKRENRDQNPMLTLGAELSNASTVMVAWGIATTR